MKRAEIVAELARELYGELARMPDAIQMREPLSDTATRIAQRLSSIAVSLLFARAAEMCRKQADHIASVHEGNGTGPWSRDISTLQLMAIGIERMAHPQTIQADSTASPTPQSTPSAAARMSE